MSGTTRHSPVDELHHIWRTRPARCNSDAMLAGVCSGVARRYDVDPTLVRVTIVVAAVFGGSGIGLYLLGWLACPGDGAPRAPRLRAPRRPNVVAAVIAVAVVAVIVPGPAWGSSGVIGAAIVLAGLWALHRRTPEPAAGTSADTLHDGGSTAPLTVLVDTVGRWTSRGGADVTHARETDSDPTTVTMEKPGATTNPPNHPPRWDPLGAAPFAWDLPEPPEHTPPPPRRDRSAITPVTLGLAVLVGALCAALAVLGVDGMTPARVAAAALTVLGLGLLFGAIRGRGSGLIGVGVLLAVAVIVLSTVTGVTSVPGGGAGERTWRPTVEGDVADEYQLTAGQATLDLRSVRLSRDRSVRVRLGAGEVRVVAPPGMNVRTRCRTSIGEEDCPQGLDRKDDGPVLDVDASTILGRVAVTRG